MEFCYNTVLFNFFIPYYLTKNVMGLKINLICANLVCKFIALHAKNKKIQVTYLHYNFIIKKNHAKHLSTFIQNVYHY